jgi:hypothetical protein
LKSDIDSAILLASTSGITFQVAFEKSLHGYEGVYAEMAALGLSAESNAWASSGREQQAELVDARRLYEAVIAHPIGARNGFVWYELAWVLDALGETQARVAECFYHAQRLLRANDTDVLHYARLMMSILDSNSNGDGGMRQSLTGVAGGLAVLVGTDVPNASHDGDSHPSVLDAILVIVVHPGTSIADAMVERVRSAVIQGIQQRSEWNARLSALITICEVATKDLDLEIPDEITSNAQRLRNLADRLTPGAETAELIDVSLAARSYLVGQLDATERELSRLERLVAGAVKERDYWMNSVRSIEAEAKEGGFELHAYSITNPFKRKLKERQEQTRLLYEQCKINLEKQEGVVISQTQRTAKEAQRHSERKAKLHELIELIDTPRLGIAAPE